MKKLIVLAALLWLGSLGWVSSGFGTTTVAAAGPASDLDTQLAAALAARGFTGTAQATFRARLGRPIDAKLANIGRLLWFDNVHSLHQDNTCGGCHSPANGFGDSQGMAIGVQSNRIVGPHRTGPRNQRRTPLVVNTAMLPALMWNGRFNATSGDPFNCTMGFVFPPPEGTTRFSGAANAAHGLTHLLQAQAHIPPTELVEVGGFTGTAGTLGPRFDQFDDGLGVNVPPPDSSGFRNEPIRQKGLEILNAIRGYRKLFREVFPQVAVIPDGNPAHDIDFFMFGKAIAEFEFTLVFADAPIDQFARGQRNAMSTPEKRGALLFFGKAGCVRCHAVGGLSNEMFSDFKERVAGVPQIAPFFGVGEGNMIFDGPGEDEDFGLEQITGDPADRYRFRTAPLRNLALSPAFFHNGAFTRLDDAIRHHLDVYESARGYDPKAAGVDRDLRMRRGPIEPVLDRLDPLLRTPIDLTRQEFNDLVKFVGDGLLDTRAKKENLCGLIPDKVPSGQPILKFQGCQ